MLLSTKYFTFQNVPFAAGRPFTRSKISLWEVPGHWSAITSDTNDAQRCLDCSYTRRIAFICHIIN